MIKPDENMLEFGRIKLKENLMPLMSTMRATASMNVSEFHVWL